MRQALVAVYLHLVWATWDRLPLLDSEIERSVWRAIEAKARELAAQPVAIGGVEDHVHLLVRMPSTITIAEPVGGTKGASAHLVNHDLRPGSSFRWQGSYAAFSVGRHQLDRAQEYIARQREHHTIGSDTVRWERSVLAQLAPTSAPKSTTPIAHNPGE